MVLTLTFDAELGTSVQHRKRQGQANAQFPRAWLVLIVITSISASDSGPVLPDRDLYSLGCETLAQPGTFNDSWKPLRAEDLKNVGKGRREDRG